MIANHQTKHDLPEWCSVVVSDYRLTGQLHIVSGTLETCRLSAIVEKYCCGKILWRKIGCTLSISSVNVLMTVAVAPVDSFLAKSTDDHICHL